MRNPFCPSMLLNFLQAKAFASAGSRKSASFGRNSTGDWLKLPDPASAVCRTQSSGSRSMNFPSG